MAPSSTHQSQPHHQHDRPYDHHAIAGPGRSGPRRSAAETESLVAGIAIVQPAVVAALRGGMTVACLTRECPLELIEDDHTSPHQRPVNDVQGDCMIAAPVTTMLDELSPLSRCRVEVADSRHLWSRVRRKHSFRADVERDTPECFVISKFLAIILMLVPLRWHCIYSTALA
jgi:hypothetical protein